MATSITSRIQPAVQLNSRISASSTITSRVAQTRSHTSTVAVTGPAGFFSTAATQAQAEAGTDNSSGMSPLRTAQAIEALESVQSVFGREGAVTAASNDYTWAQVDKTTSNIADITTKSHTSLTDKGTNTHAQLDTHVASTSNPHSVTKTQVGLGNVDDVQQQPLDSDLTTIAGLTATTDNFMVGTASAWASRTPTQARTQMGLGSLATLSSVGTTEIQTGSVTLGKIQDISADRILGRVSTGSGVTEQLTAANVKTVLSLVKGDVGLGNVDNTSDASKPISTATQTALDTKVDENAGITGATKTKITYDAKGLVTAGADATQDDIGDGTTNKQYSATDKTKLAGVETAADVTDATNVDAAGATMNTDTSLVGNGYFLDEDDFVSDSATKVPSQQSAKAYIASQIAASGGGDFSSDTSTSVDSELVLFSGTGGKTGKRATGTGYAKLTSGVLSSVTTATAAADILAVAYPVGAIYISTLSTNPATLMGFGTWAVFGAGKTLVSLDSGDTDFDTAEETGGTKAVTLTGAQSGTSAHTHTVYGTLRSLTASGSTFRGLVSSTDSDVTSAPSTAANAAESHTNLQPYITVYMWKRTA